MTNPAEAAIAAAKAKAKAAEVVPTGPQEGDIETVRTVSPGGAVSHVIPQAQEATLDMLANAGMNVDGWIKAKGEGLKIDEQKGFATDLIVAMSLKDIKAFYGIRYGNPVQYRKSYDRVTCLQGGTWNEAMTQAKNVDPQFKGDYMGADIRMKLLEPAKTEGGAVLMEAGKLLGHGTSPTGSKTVAALIREAKEKKIPEDQVMKVKVTHEQKTKPGVEPWGVLNFEILEEEYIDDSMAGE